MTSDEYPRSSVVTGVLGRQQDHPIATNKKTPGATEVTPDASGGEIVAIIIAEIGSPPKGKNRPQPSLTTAHRNTPSILLTR